jgi:hypothetical protein
MYICTQVMVRRSLEFKVSDHPEGDKHLFDFDSPNNPDFEVNLFQSMKG